MAASGPRVPEELASGETPPVEPAGGYTTGGSIAAEDDEKP